MRIIGAGEADGHVLQRRGSCVREADRRHELQRHGGRRPTAVVTLQRLCAVSSCVRQALTASGWLLHTNNEDVVEDSRLWEEAPVRRGHEYQAVSGLPGLEPYANEPRDSFRSGLTWAGFTGYSV